MKEGSSSEGQQWWLVECFVGENIKLLFARKIIYTNVTTTTSQYRRKYQLVQHWLSLPSVPSYPIAALLQFLVLKVEA
jgi:hypothetical protein